MPDFVRTSIVLDDEQIDRAKALTGLRSKRAVVDEALRTLIRLKEQESIRALRGQLHWEENLKDLHPPGCTTRDSDAPDSSKGLKSGEVGAVRNPASGS